MNSHAWMNGQHQQVGRNSQKAATQLTLDTIWNQQDGTANNSCQYSTFNTGVQQPQGADLFFHNGVHSNWQTSVVPQKTVSSQMPAGGRANNYYVKTLKGNLKNSFQNMQSGNPCLLVTDGCQVATQQDFHPNSGVVSSSSQCPPSMMQPKTMYHQQDMSTHWNHRVTTQWKQSVRTQDPNVVSKNKNCRLLRGLLHNTNEELNNLNSAFKTTATSLVRQQEVCTSTLRSATAHNGQTAHNQNHTLAGAQHGINVIPLPSYHAAVSQSFRSKSLTTNSSTAEHTWHFSSVNQKKDPRQNPVHHKSTYNIGEGATQRFMTKTNELTLNPAFDSREQMLRQQKIARIAKDLQNSFDGASENNPPGFIYLPHTGNQLVREARMRGSHQNMQPVTLTVSEGHNSNSSQSLPLNSGLSLPKTTHGVVTRTQHSVNGLQQSSLPNVRVMTTRDGSGNGNKADDTLFSKSNRVSKGNMVELLSGASQVVKLTESILPQKNMTDLCGAKNHEVLEIVDMLSSVQANDSSVHSSPGCTGRRAIAVVQPLSQESYQAGSNNTSSSMTREFTGLSATKEIICDHEKSLMSSSVAKDKNACLTEGSNQLMSSKSIISHSMAYNNSTAVSSSGSVEDQDLSLKRLCADDSGSKSTVIMQVDQQVTLPAQQSVTDEVPINQSGDEDKYEKPTDPKACAVDLSSIPTISWTAVTLNKLVVDAEKAQMECSRDSKMLDLRRMLINMLWDGNFKTVVYKLKTNWYKDLISNVKQFCSKHLTSETAVLSQVKDDFKDQLKHYYFLKDDEVYTEQPYKSSWLNVNEQLDDIDKEFGFSWSLKNGLYSPESLSQSVEVGTVNSNHEQTPNEFSNKVLSQTELEPIVSGEEKEVVIVEATSTQPVSSSETDSMDSSDPYYTFEIQVLPPEEAKVIFEQTQTNIQSNDTVRHPERVLDTSVEDESLEGKDVVLNDLELENRVCPFEQVCCLSRLMEMFGGPNTPLSKCQCKNDQSLKDCTDRTLAKEDMAVEKEDKLCANMCDNMDGENQTKSRENVDHRIKTCSWLELCDEQTNAFTEKDHKPHLFSDKEPKNASQINLNSSQSSIVVISEDEDDPSSSDAEIQSDHEVDCVQDQIKSTRSTLSCTSFSSDKENKNPSSSESKPVSQTSDPEDDCEKAQLESTDVAESSFETKEQTKISTTPAFKTTTSLSEKHKTVEKKWKKQSIHTRFIPFNSKSNKRKNADEPSTHQKVFIDSIELKPIASNVRAVQLVLFGSAPEDQHDLISSRRKQTIPQGAGSNGVTQPPKVVSVKLSPLRRKSDETVTLEEYSVKQMIYEKWRKSFPPPIARCRGKLKMQKCTFASSSGVSPKKAETVGPTVTEKLTASSEMRICNRSTKSCLSLKRRRSLSNGLKGGEEERKKKRDAITLKQPSGQKQSNAKNGSPADTSLKESVVLRFSVLPSTSNFQDGSSDRNEATDPLQNKLALVAGKEESVNKTITKEKGTWYPNPEKKCCPRRCPPVPKTFSIFHEFQKKYKEKTQTSMDK